MLIFCLDTVAERMAAQHAREAFDLQRKLYEESRGRAPLHSGTHCASCGAPRFPTDASCSYCTTSFQTKP
jgi:uncharacterized OB-fold protein